MFKHYSLLLVIVLWGFTFLGAAGNNAIYSNPLANTPELSSQDSGTPRTIYTAPYMDNFNSYNTNPPFFSNDWTPTTDTGYWWFGWIQGGNATVGYAGLGFSESWSGQKAYLYSPYIIIPGPMYKLFFKWSKGVHATYPYDIGSVKISANGGAYTTVWERYGTDFDSHSGSSNNGPGTFIQESLDLSLYAGQTIRVCFEGTSCYGPAWFMDDFDIHYVDSRITSFPVTETFAGTFPPVNWVNAYWWRTDNINAYGVAGAGSATTYLNTTHDFYDLSTPFINTGNKTSLLTFDCLYAHSAQQMGMGNSDSLEIMYSTNYGLSFTSLITYSGAPGGALENGSVWTTKSFVIPQGANTVKFRATNNWSGALYLDNVKFELIYFASGIGSQTDPYQIYTSADLNIMRQYLGDSYSNKYFKLMNDVDLTSYLAVGGEGYTTWGTAGWEPLGSSTTRFAGHFDGNNNKITGLKFNRPANSDCGFWGYTQTGSTIDNLTIETAIGSNVTGYNSTGIIAGHNYGTITNSSAKGSVRGNLYVGAISGMNEGIINRCFSSGDVIGTSNTVGGLVGQNYTTITNSYSTASASGVHYIGGLVGYHGSGTITNCFAAGAVSGGQKGGLCGASAGTVTNCLWDMQTSGINTSYGGMGKTTAQMKTYSSYTNWDFAGETINGTNDYWQLNLLYNNGYPFLSWERPDVVRAPIITYPANAAIGMPIAGDDLSWTPNTVGPAPIFYNVYMVKGDVTQILNSAYPGQHTYTGISGTSFNPVYEAGLSMNYSDVWYWTVDAVASNGSMALALSSYSFEVESFPTVTVFPCIQDFSSSSFPSLGWSIPVLSPAWSRSTANAFGSTPEGSAMAGFYSLTSGSIEMVSPPFNLAGITGRLSFDYAYATRTTQNDQLEILYSTNNGTSYTSLIVYTGGSAGTMVTVAPQATAFTPGITQWATKNLVLPAGTNRIKYKGISAAGNNLYIDNIKIGYGFSSGAGTATDPFQISTARELNNVRNYLGSTTTRFYFKLMNDINLTTYLAMGGEGYMAWGNAGWAPIGGSGTPFYSYFNGNNHKISGLKINSPGVYECAFFSYTGTGSVIENLRLETASGSSVYGYRRVGMLVGTNLGTVNNCSASGTVAGGGWTGGLVGWNEGTVNRCFSSGSVIGSENTIGGLVGQNYTSITNSYSRASASGVHYIGGLVGYHGGGTITNCFATGTTAGGQRGGLCGASGGTVTNSFWDTQTSGIASSYGGTGKTTAEMKLQSTFTGWDFAHETANGTNDYWNISSMDNAGYPHSTWEHVNEFRVPVQTYPANGATGLARSGFNLTWSQNPVGITPVYYVLNLYLTDSNTTPIIISNITATTFNPVTQGGLTFNYDEIWYWTVKAVDANNNFVITDPPLSFQTEPDLSIHTFPYTQDFSSTTFPPLNWTIPATTPAWVRNTVNAFGVEGTGSIMANFWYIASGINFDLISPILNSGISQLLLSFDHAYAAYSGSLSDIDKLEILSSTDNGANYSSLIIYEGGESGPLTTASPLSSPFTPNATQWATKSLNLPSGTNMVIFRALSAYGNNLYLDNIKFETINLVIPTNLTIQNGSFAETVTLSWDDMGSPEYHIYTSDDAITWSDTYITVADHTYTFNSSSISRKFFKVTSSTATVSSPAILARPPVPVEQTRVKDNKKVTKIKKKKI